MNVERIVRSGQICAPLGDALERAIGRSGPAHQFQNPRHTVLHRNIEVRQHQTIRHQRQQLVDVRIWIHVVQTNPRNRRPSSLHNAIMSLRNGRPSQKSVRYLRSSPYALVSWEMTSNSLTPDRARPAASSRTSPILTRAKFAAQRRNDAERTLVIAPLRDLQIGVVSRREFDTHGRDQINEGVARRLRDGIVHRLHDRFVCCGSGDGQDIRKLIADQVRARAKAARDDDASVLRHRLHRWLPATRRPRCR